MKSLYFQTVGIECKFYENQQLEYRLYSWGRSVFEKSFLQIVTHILQKAFFKHALGSKIYTLPLKLFRMIAQNLLLCNICRKNIVTVHW